MIDPDSPEAQALLEPLVKLLEDEPEMRDRQRIFELLSAYGPSAAAAVPALRRALGSKVETEINRADVQKRVMILLGEIGPAAQAALPELEALLREDQRYGGRGPDWYAIQAIQKIKGTQPAPKR